MSLYYMDDSREPHSAAVCNSEIEDPSLTPRRAAFNAVSFNLKPEQMNDLFFGKYGIGYIPGYFGKGRKFRVVSYPKATNTCYEKAGVLENWDPLNVIKALYYEFPGNDCLYAAVIPETGCFLNKPQFAGRLGLSNEICLAKTRKLPRYMTYGTCSPFIAFEDLDRNGGCVKQIVFDSETLAIKKHENQMDDFSFGLDHRFSIQMNYYQCYKMLKQIFGDAIRQDNLLNLAFTERLTRKNGRIKIEYEFETLNYRTASFINGIHGYGDVTITNDHVDELDLPVVLVRSSNGSTRNEERRAASRGRDAQNLSPLPNSGQESAFRDPSKSRFPILRSMR